MSVPAAWLCVHPTDSDERGAQRLHVVDDYPELFAMSALGTDIGNVLSHVTGDERAYDLGAAIVNARRNVSVRIAPGLTASVFPAHAESGLNLSRDEADTYDSIGEALAALTS